MSRRCGNTCWLLSLDTHVNEITMNAHLVLVDKYGGESTDKVMAIRMSKGTWEKINWDNFLIDNLPSVADTYWEHPAIRD